MINYGYFRHRFDAHDNIKLNGLVDEMGVAAYGYYYTLLEIYGAHYSKSKESLEVSIHIRTLANVWRKRVDSCERVLTKLQLSGLIELTLCDSICNITINNFLKYYGSYKKKEPHNAPKKRKEKKRKENKIKKESLAEKQPNHVGDFCDYLNQKTGSNFKPSTAQTKKFVSARISDGYTQDDFETVINYLVDRSIQNKFDPAYIRPQTILAPSNFESYLSAAVTEFEMVKREREAALKLLGDAEISGDDFKKTGMGRILDNAD